MRLQYIFFFILGWMDTDVFSGLRNLQMKTKIDHYYCLTGFDAYIIVIKRAMQEWIIIKISITCYWCSADVRCCVLRSFETPLGIATTRSCKHLWHQIQFNKTWFFQLALQNMEGGDEFNKYQWICFYR